MSSERTSLSADSMVPILRSKMAHRVAALESEAEVLRRAIAALDGIELTDVFDRTANGSEVAEVIVRSLDDAPGSRASMLALVAGIPADDVTRMLVELESRGSVRREGLGWSLVR